MKNKELIKQLYHFIIKLSLKTDRESFDSLRNEWEELKNKVETKLK